MTVYKSILTLRVRNQGPPCDHCHLPHSPHSEVEGVRIVVILFRDIANNRSFILDMLKHNCFQNPLSDQIYHWEQFFRSPAQFGFWHIGCFFVTRPICNCRFSQWNWGTHAFFTPIINIFFLVPSEVTLEKLICILRFPGIIIVRNSFK